MSSLFPKISLLLAGAVFATSSIAMQEKTIDMNGHTLSVEVAATTFEQRIGLMNRVSLPADNGMLFIFEPPHPVSMWMKNTLIDLDAIFVTACGYVVNQAKMKKGSMDLHRSNGPVYAVIEANTGWFEKNGIEPGSVIKDLINPKYCIAPKENSQK